MYSTSSPVNTTATSIDRPTATAEATPGSQPRLATRPQTKARPDKPITMANDEIGRFEKNMVIRKSAVRTCSLTADAIRYICPVTVPPLKRCPP